jgi:hypothetical protein
MSNTILLPFQPDSMTRAQVAAVSYLARYSGHTHSLYAYQLRRWFEWCEVLPVLEACRGERTEGPLVLRPVSGKPINRCDCAQILARHADPRTTEQYDRARGNLDRHGVHFRTAYVAGV